MFMNTTSKTNRSVAVVEEARAAREARALEKKRVDAAIIIQSFVRRCLCVKHLRAENQREFYEVFSQFAYPSEAQPSLTAEDAFSHLRQFFFLFNGRDDQERFRNVCFYLTRSIACEKPQYSYMSILQKTEFVSTWRRQVLLILQLCVRYLRLLNPENVADAKDLILYSQVIIMLTHASQWKAVKIPNEIVQKVMNGLTFKWLQELIKAGLYPSIKEVLMRGMARTKPSFTSNTLFPLLTLTVRPMVQAAFATEIDLQKTVIRLYTVPGLLLHVATICPEFIVTLKKQNLLKIWNGLLTTDKAWLMLRQELTTVNATLSVTANLLYAFWLDRSDNSEVEVLHAVSTIIFLLDLCREITSLHQSAASKWHPILGWSSDRPDPSYHDSMGFVQQQLEIIHKKDFVRIVFGQSLERKAESATIVKKSGAVGNSKALAMLHKLGLSVAKNPSRLQLGEGEVGRLAIVCAMYQTAINCLSRLKLNILTGLCAEGQLPVTLWGIIKNIGGNMSQSVSQFTELLKPNPNTFTTEFQLLGLFCNLTAHLITVMDDLELYEEEKIFTVSDLSDMSKFLNDLTFRLIWYEYMPAAQLKTDALFMSVVRLLNLLYQRNARRRFAPDEHWIMKEAKGSSFFSELKDKQTNAQQLLIYAPQCIPHHDRVKLLRQWIKEERAIMQETAKSPILITVQRRRIVEDGYQYISRLSPEELKGTVRVRFVNVEGVTEAGIDQDGVFKEFLEETLKSVFDPNLQLFRATADNRLYPSPNSSIQDNHIQLFNFVGRVLGKALYEGIVVDVPLANFFLSQVLGFHTANSAYSYFDELPSFDLDLYKQLSNLKRYPGDVADFSLTFACDSECFGQVVENDLLPGGRYMEVTEENKILYIHLMAHWRMHSQIKQQVNAFIQGFYTVIKPEWVSMFSSPDLQKLISGSEKIDLNDLRKNTHYYGGFHSSHRIIGWLWDVLNNDFTEEERGLFLKFVTSCSKPPVLGFQYLEPPFSIRLVEVGEDQDSGDTLGSVIRGFFTISSKKAASVGRLPTTSTCFNLLKLPSYPKKSVLREKLRYAIRSNSGFELS